MLSPLLNRCWTNRFHFLIFSPNLLYCLEMHLLSGGCRASEEVEGGSGTPKTVSILTCGGDYCNFVQDNIWQVILALLGNVHCSLIKFIRYWPAVWSKWKYLMRIDDQQWFPSWWWWWWWYKVMMVMKMAVQRWLQKSKMSKSFVKTFPRNARFEAGYHQRHILNILNWIIK